MSNEFSTADAERVLTELGTEISGRIRSMDESTSAPKMDAAVGRLSYIDALQQQQMSLHGRRKLNSQLAAIRSALKRVPCTCAARGTAAAAQTGSSTTKT